MDTVTLTIPLTFTKDQLEWLLRDLRSPANETSNWGRLHKSNPWQVDLCDAILKGLEAVEPKAVETYRKTRELMRKTELYQMCFYFDYPEMRGDARLCLMGEDGIAREIAYTLCLFSGVEKKEHGSEALQAITDDPWTFAEEYAALGREWLSLTGTPLPGPKPHDEICQVLRACGVSTTARWLIERNEQGKIVRRFAVKAQDDDLLVVN